MTKDNDYFKERDEALKQFLDTKLKGPQHTFRTASDWAYNYAQKTMIPMSEVEKLIYALECALKEINACGKSMYKYRPIVVPIIKSLANYKQFIESRNKTEED